MAHVPAAAAAPGRALAPMAVARAPVGRLARAFGSAPALALARALALAPARASAATSGRAFARGCAPRPWLGSWLGLWLALCALGVAAPAAAEIRLTDIAGHEVVLPAPAQRLVLGEARHLSVLGILRDDPVALVAGWRLDKGLEPVTLAAYRARFPALDAIRPVGAGNRGLSAESVIALAPDLVVLSLVDATDPQMRQPLAQLDAAGIPVVFVDFFSHPLENSMPSLRLLGRLTGTEARAESFAAFYEARLARIRDRLATAAEPAPRVFIQVHAAPSGCCATVGNGVFHDFIEAAGGHNIGGEVVPGLLGSLSLEHLLAADPDIFLATGGQHMAARGGLVLGPGVPAGMAEDSFARLLAAPGLSDLRAVREGHALAIWHLFNDSPVHIALIEYLARAFHPDLFADLDPLATLEEVQARFSPVQLPGTWWLPAEPAR